MRCGEWHVSELTPDVPHDCVTLAAGEVLGSNAPQPENICRPDLLLYSLTLDVELAG